MSYCTVAEIQAIPALQWQNVAEETILHYINQAEMIIDMHCRSHGFPTVPFTTVPPEINMICVKMTICQMLHEVKGLMGVDDANIYQIQEYCKEAHRLLSGVQSGKLNMTDPVVNEQHTGAGSFTEGIDWTAIDDPDDPDYKKPWEL
jgi:hypothetical protein